MISARRLREVLSYNRRTGIFVWRVALSPRVTIGSVAGNNTIGYIRIRIDGRSYRAHRLAWLYVTGRWPTNEIDHRNGERADNRFSNLREATCTQNRCNTKRTSRNTSGVKGVSWHAQAGRWMAQITVERRHVHLGLFVNLDDAANAYAEGARELHGKFARIE